jgi:hypothetical protein
MDENDEGPRIKNRKITYICYILCHNCLQLCQVSILAHVPLVCPGWLLYCFLSSTTSASCHATTCRLAAPLPVHLSSCRRLSSYPSSSLVWSRLVYPGWLLCHLSSCCRLPSTCASTSHCTATSHHAPLMPFVWLVVALPLITQRPPIHWRLRLLMHHRLLLCPSHAPCPLWLVDIMCLIFPPLTSRHGSHATARKSMKYCHHIHGCDV